MSAADTSIDPLRTLRERFGLEQFRAGQREVIDQVLARRDVLCVMPTGGGKSLCYQLPALLLDGLTLVVSPLIALMKDQVDALTAKGVRATQLNSTLDPAEQRVRLAEIEAGLYDLVYVAPERFRSGRFVESMARLGPALLAIDEAHCISEWGHDFRPDYARIGLARRRLGMPPCIALTATATDLVRRDIADQLDLREPAQFVTGFDRPNLSYHVVAARRDQEKLAALADVLKRAPGPSIIYASSRARCETIGQFLRTELRRPAVVYHAGLERQERAEAQERFMDGDVEIVVATNAFGMGVDKADVRSVIHYNMPGTLEAYYQEAGRAGRDGLPARCALLFAAGDRFLQEMFIENEYPPPDVVHRVYEYLRGLDADPIELTQAEIKESSRVELNESAVGTVLKILEGSGALERFRPRENMAIVRINAEADEGSLVERLSPQAHVQRTVLLGVEGLINNRLNEPVYFQPDDFAARLGLDRVALGRALRNLAAELPVDYIPPFRGNALRIADRSKKARDLVIDFKALDARKRQEYEKLERMVKYAKTGGCRRAYILGYFADGQAGAVPCGQCDNCDPSDGPRPPATEAAAIETTAGREVIQKALSGVARARGRFGKTLVAQMLTGSGSEKISRLGLAKLSTFGVLKEFRQPEVMQILDALTEAGLVESQEVDRFKPIIAIAEPGLAWLKSSSPGPLTLDLTPELSSKIRNGGLERRSRPATPAPVTAARPAAPVAESEEDDDASAVPGGDLTLRERLRALRTEWAREGNLSPAYVFSNETLDILATERPRTPHALGSIKGIGPSKLERYGTKILAAINGSAPSPPGPPSGPSIRVVDRPVPAPRPAEPPAAAGPDRNGESLPPAVAAPRPASTPAATPAPRPAEGRSTSPSASSYVSTEEWTWRLLDRGFTLDEAAAIRGLERSAIVRHALWVSREGKVVPLAAFLTPEARANWDGWRREHGDTPPPEDLGGPLALWPVYLAAQSAP